MLHSNEKGFATMTKDLKAISIEHISFETCNMYCRKGYVVAERIPYVCGISISIRFYKYRPYITWRKEYAHKTGKIVYEA